MHHLQIHCKKDCAMPAQRLKLTEAACKNAPPNTKIWDTEIKGFGLFTGKERKTFYYQKDVSGKTVRTRLGIWPETRATDARYEAAQLVAQYASGAVARRLQASRIPTLEQALETYLARPKLRSEQNKRHVEQQMRGHLGTWLRTPLDQVTKADCVRAHAQVARSGERIANHVLKTFRSIYNHARRVHELPECPTMAVEFFAEAPSGKIIDDLNEWREVVDQLPNPVHASFYRFLLFTGLRRAEALTLRWDQIHADYLHLPVTKNGRAFDLPLLDTHHDIIAPMRAYRSEWVFHGQRNDVHLKEPARLSWSPHAHRRTFATVASTDAGLFDETVGRLLNHTPTSVTGARYVVTDHNMLREPMTKVVACLNAKHLI
jgi:integrase